MCETDAESQFYSALKLKYIHNIYNTMFYNIISDKNSKKCLFDTIIK